MRVFITGIAGFLGAHLARRFLSEGWEVEGADLVPPDQAWRLRGIKVGYLWGSLQDLKTIRAPYVVHCAAVADVPFALSSPFYTAQQNILGTVSLLEACLRNKKQSPMQRVLIMSSESVYGLTSRVPIPEDTPMNPTNIYGASKAAEELVARAYYYSHHLPVVVVRCSTLYGEGMRKTQVIPIFLAQALSNHPITIHGDGSQTRDFVYVEDLTRGIENALLLPGTAGDVYNIASGREISIKGLAELCIAITGSSSHVEHLEQRTGEQGLRLVLDTTKAQQVLGYHASVSLQDGIKKLATSLREAPPSSLIASGFKGSSV